MARLDPHSYADHAQPRAAALTWNARVDFSTCSVQAHATLHLDTAAEADGPMDLDTRDLRIESVADQNEAPLEYDLARAEPILGSRLRIQLRRGTDQVQIRYRTEPTASALQWLEPDQTMSGTHPFLYTQCQPIHTRSVVPLQDTPRTRLRFEAELTVPEPLAVVMAAEAIDQHTRGDERVARFSMRQPIAPYLFAFAVGELVARDVGRRCRVWAEPAIVDAAAWEFADTERALETGESLFGAYDWERYDVLVLPPSFPYGGMENPRLTFLTSAVVAGDRSLVSVVAHELAHSWTGNLISNANAEHFWLNEGWTTYAERRIVEALWGSDVAALDWALGRRELDATLDQLTQAGHADWTRLRTELHGIDPDDAFSLVPYEKGALLLRALEDTVGRPAFDAFLRRYIDAFRFGVLTTEEFVAFAEQHLGSATLEAVDVRTWLYQPGLPGNVPRIISRRLQAIEDLRGQPPSEAQARAWTAIEWQLYLGTLGEGADLAGLDQRFDLTQSRNYDVLVKWLTVGIPRGYAPAIERVQDVVCRVGRIKYLRDLYRGLMRRPDTRQLADTLFQRCQAKYHPVARAVIATLLSEFRR